MTHSASPFTVNQVLQTVIKAYAHMVLILSKMPCDATDLDIKVQNVIQIKILLIKLSNTR